MNAYNFLVIGPTFTSLFRGRVVVDKVLSDFRRRTVPAIFAIKIESGQKSR